jgi:hypothetical protein
MHAPFDYYAGEDPGDGGKPTKFHRYRVLLLVEYTNTPEDFEVQYPEFVRLLNKMHMLTDAMLLKEERQAPAADDVAKPDSSAPSAPSAPSVAPPANAQPPAAVSPSPANAQPLAPLAPLAPPANAQLPATVSP